MYTGTTKQVEYERTAELLVEITEEHGVYFAVALLYDSGYTPHDIKQVMVVMERRKIGFSRKWLEKQGDDNGQGQAEAE